MPPSQPLFEQEPIAASSGLPRPGRKGEGRGTVQALVIEVGFALRTCEMLSRPVGRHASFFALSENDKGRRG